MASHTITIIDTQEQFSCKETQHLLDGMFRMRKKGIPTGCRGGGCGVCKITIRDGVYETKKMSRSRVTEREEQSGTVLACRVFPRSDLQLKVVGLLDKALTSKKSDALSTNKEK